MKKIYCDYCYKEIINEDLAGDYPTFHTFHTFFGGGYDIEITIKYTVLGKRSTDLHRGCLLKVVKSIDE